MTPIYFETKAVIIVAFYNDDKFVSCETAEYTDKEISITTQIQHDSAKVMAWENLANIKPVCDAKIMN